MTTEELDVPRRSTFVSSQHAPLNESTADCFPELSRQEMSDAKIPLAYRDSCADLLVPLNRCRFETYYLPWKCEVSQPMSPRQRTVAKTQERSGQMLGWAGGNG